MTSKDIFNLEEILKNSISDLKEFEDVYSYLLEIREEKLATRCTDSSLRDIASELISRIYKSGKNED